MTRPTTWPWYTKGAQPSSLWKTYSSPAPTEEERRCRALWQQFYQTVSIQQRENPRCQMSHMPKRFWADLTEDPGGLRQKQLGRKGLGD